MARIPSDMLGGLEARWAGFRNNIAETLQQMNVGEYFVLAIPSTEYFVQALRQGSDCGGHTIVLEACAPVERGGPADLTPVQQMELLELGWAQPDEDDNESSQNYITMWITDHPADRISTSDAVEAAELLVSTLRGPFDVGEVELIDADHGRFPAS